MLPKSVPDLILRNRHFLDQFANDTYRRMIDEIKDAQKSIIEELTKLGLDQLTKKHYRAMLAETTSILNEAYDTMPEIVQDGMSETAKIEYNAVANALRTEAGMKKLSANLANKGLPDKALSSILRDPVGGTLLQDWVDLNHAKAVERIRSTLGQSLIRGWGMGKTASEIRKRSEMSYREAETLARTSIMEASNKALKQAYSDYSDLIISYVWVATLDSRTCPICADLDGTVHKNIDLFPPVPSHCNCRCLISPRTEYDTGEAQRPYKVTDQEGQTIDVGKIPAKTEYSDWFAEQDADFQKRYLGPKRYDLYKKGEISFSQFSDTNTGRVLNLRELESKYDVEVFKKKIN